MVRGFDSFKRWFSGYESNYTIIGGTACDLIMTDMNQDFRATKDIDIVLIIEALSPEFGLRFWDYIKQAGYEHCNKSNGKPQFYRFTKPSSPDYPAMIELFSRKTDVINLPEDAVLTPIPMDEDVSSLSAILLDDNYYEFLKSGKFVLDGVTILDAVHIIPFKMKAWLDLSERKQKGESIDSKNIRKHKNDIFRLSELITAETLIEVPSSIFQDIKDFIEQMASEDLDSKSLGLRRGKTEMLQRIRDAYTIKK